MASIRLQIDHRVKISWRVLPQVEFLHRSKAAILAAALAPYYDCLYHCSEQEHREYISLVGECDLALRSVKYVMPAPL